MNAAAAGLKVAMTDIVGKDENDVGLLVLRECSAIPTCVGGAGAADSSA
jgi:hypothetical protein